MKSKKSFVPTRDDFRSAKKVLTSNPVIMSLLDTDPADYNSEKFVRLVGLLSFICLDGTWDEVGHSQVPPGSPFEELVDASAFCEEVLYGDIFYKTELCHIIGK